MHTACSACMCPPSADSSGASSSASASITAAAAIFFTRVIYDDYSCFFPIAAAGKHVLLSNAVFNSVISRMKCAAAAAAGRVSDRVSARSSCTD